MEDNEVIKNQLDQLDIDFKKSRIKLEEKFDQDIKTKNKQIEQATELYINYKNKGRGYVEEVENAKNRAINLSDQILSALKIDEIDQEYQSGLQQLNQTLIKLEEERDDLKHQFNLDDEKLQQAHKAKADKLEDELFDSGKNIGNQS